MIYAYGSMECDRSVLSRVPIPALILALVTTFEDDETAVAHGFLAALMVVDDD